MKEKVSVIIPVFNGEKTIKTCLQNIIKKNKNLKKEIIVINDNSNDNTSKILKTFKNIKVFNLKQNKGVGFARNYGAKKAKYNFLCYVDSDLIISTNSISKLIKRLKKDKSTGSVGGIQKVINLTKNNWSSNFVCLKSCYGFEDVNDEVEFSVIHSEFCVIQKKYLLKIGGWKSYSNAGGEEFEIGHRITQSEKKIVLIKEAFYSTYYTDLTTRFKKIIDRTDKYLGILIKKKYFDTKGSFATGNQAFSAVLTTLNLCFLLLNIFLPQKIDFLNIAIILLLIQLYAEKDFLFFAKKYFGIKMFIYSIYGIQVINLGILFGAVKFCFKKILFLN